MKVTDLKGAQLDYWVAKAEGLALSVDWNQGDYILVGAGSGDLQRFSPSTDWSAGGPIIDRERITVIAWKRDQWGAFVGDQHPYLDVKADWDEDATGPTPLVAAMRAYVKSKFGEEVPDSAD